MPHTKRPGSRKGRWENYNRHRAAHRALDRQRRRARAEQRAAAYLAALPLQPAAIPAPVLGKPFAKIRIDFGSGRTTTITARRGPFGLIISPTRLAAWLRREIAYEQATAPATI